MKHMANTLYVTQPDAKLNKEGETIIVTQGEQKLIQLPAHTIGQIVCFGFSIYVTPPLMAYCAENAISISWLSEGGKFLGKVEGPVRGNVLLRREQYRWADQSDKTLSIAKCIVAAKINNSRMNLQRLQRNQPEAQHDEMISERINQLSRLLAKTDACDDLNLLRGIEGEAASAYFSIFDRMILQQKETFKFNGRNRRPPLDRVNALLSFVYTLLVVDIRSALETVGLDPYVGFLHADRPGRPSLALDLMEEFRAPFADRLVLSLINLKQIQENDFEAKGLEISLTPEGRKKLILAYQNRKKETIEHPFLQEKMEIGLIFHIQALLLARHIRGDLDFYPAMIWK